MYTISSVRQDLVSVWISRFHNFIIASLCPNFFEMLLLFSLNLLLVVSCTAKESLRKSSSASFSQSAFEINSSSNLTTSSFSPSGAPIEDWNDVASSQSGQYVFGVVEYGPIYYSFNFGMNFTQSYSPISSWNAIATSDDGQNVIAVGSYIFTSSDFGVTWQNTSAPALYDWSCVAASGDFQFLYAGTENGTLFLSADGGKVWGKTDAKCVVDGDGGWLSLASSSTGEDLI